MSAPAKAVKLHEWETLETEHHRDGLVVRERVRRFSVPGGWIYYRDASVPGVFVADRWDADPVAESLLESLAAAEIRAGNLGAKLREVEQRHAALQDRCYEGFPSATDGIFDADKAMREAARRLAPYLNRYCDQGWPGLSERDRDEANNARWDLLAAAGVEER